MCKKGVGGIGRRDFLRVKIYFSQLCFPTHLKEMTYLYKAAQKDILPTSFIDLYSNIFWLTLDI